MRALVREGSEPRRSRRSASRSCAATSPTPTTVLRAADGCEYVIHSAAVLGGQTQVAGEHEAVNVVGTGHVLDAAAKVGATRVVQLSTTTFFDAQRRAAHRALAARPEPERRSVHGHQARRLPRRHAPGRRRPGHLHRDLGGAPTACRRCPSARWWRRATTPASRWRWRARSPSTSGSRSRGSYAGDVAQASVVATRKGVAGERYLAFGRPATSAVCRGSATWRSRSPAPTSGSPRWRSPSSTTPTWPPASGPAWWRWPGSTSRRPFFVNDQTVERLGYEPLTLREGLERTIPWMREHDLL